VPQLPGFFNVAWVDGSHEQIAVLNDLWNCTGKTPLILVDDYRLTGVRKAIDEFATESDYELVASYTQ
jgi:hypothetical protein